MRERYLGAAQDAIAKLMRTVRKPGRSLIFGIAAGVFGHVLREFATGGL